MKDRSDGKMREIIGASDHSEKNRRKMVLRETILRDDSKRLF